MGSTHPPTHVNFFCTVRYGRKEWGSLLIVRWTSGAGVCAPGRGLCHPVFLPNWYFGGSSICTSLLPEQKWILKLVYNKSTQNTTIRILHICKELTRPMGHFFSKLQSTKPIQNTQSISSIIRSACVLAPCFRASSTYARGLIWIYLQMRRICNACWMVIQQAETFDASA